MIFGVGTDIVHVSRMQENLDRYGEKFAQRILSDIEFVEFSQTTRQAHFLAKRFAAKEAMAKALGTGFRDGLHLRHITVSHDDSGRPLLDCIEKAGELLTKFGVTRSHISLSDEAEYAIAFVTLESA